jgi:hypothetical protein
MPRPSNPHPEDYCGRCNGPNPSWHAASPLWNAVMRTGEREPFDGIVCPSCFAFLAAEAGVAVNVCLTAHPSDLQALLATTFGDGRVWDGNRCMWVAA